MISSLPLVFTAGFVWPLESIPETIQTFSQLAPSTSAIQGFLKLNQMGAELQQIGHHIALLVVLAIGYLSGALLLNERRNRNFRRAHRRRAS
jgi:ABC-2 type transport system permease protein